MKKLQFFLIIFLISSCKNKEVLGYYGTTFQKNKIILNLNENNRYYINTGSKDSIFVFGKWDMKDKNLKFFTEKNSNISENFSFLKDTLSFEIDKKELVLKSDKNNLRFSKLILKR